MFDAVSLGPHQERIRKMLLADDPGSPEQYGFVAIVPIVNGKFFADFILEPDCRRSEHGHLYRAVIGGILYMFTVSNRPSARPNPRLFIQKNGDWIVECRDVRKIEFLSQWFDEASKLK